MNRVSLVGPAVCCCLLIAAFLFLVISDYNHEMATRPQTQAGSVLEDKYITVVERNTKGDKRSVYRCGDSAEVDESCTTDTPQEQFTLVFRSADGENVYVHNVDKGVYASYGMKDTIQFCGDQHEICPSLGDGRRGDGAPEE